VKRLAILLLPLLLGSAFFAPPTVYTIGDSTMADYGEKDTDPAALRGWGQLLQGYFRDDVKVRDLAVSGRSTKSYIDEGRWAEVLEQLKPGDYLFIQFGHNDEKREDPKRFTNPLTGYRHNLERFVTESRARGAIPILFSPLTRRHFNDKGVLEDTHGLYPLVAREVARDLDVPFIDLQLRTEEMILEAGVAGSKRLFHRIAPGVDPRYPDGFQDNTHLSIEGARLVAGFAVDGLKRLDVPLAVYTRPFQATAGR
jgi:lysophospholipase L1-like esterase